MQKLVIDCQSGKQQFVELTSQEELDRLAEIAQAQQDMDKEQKKLAKQQLVRILVELQAMKDNLDVFSLEDIAEKQTEVDSLKGLMK